MSLIHALSNTTLWNDDFEGPMRDIVSLQGEMALTIAREIQAEELVRFYESRARPVRAGARGCARGAPQTAGNVSSSTG